jgi:hypothetical protein
LEFISWAKHGNEQPFHGYQNLQKAHPIYSDRNRWGLSTVEDGTEQGEAGELGVALAFFYTFAASMAT